MDTKLVDWSRIAWLSCALTLSMACGGDEGNGDGAPDASTLPSDGVSDASTTDTTTTSGPTDAGANTMMAVMTLTCDESADQTATCGGVECPVSPMAAMTCVVPCCVDVDGQDQCGSRNTSAEIGSDACNLPPDIDETCPGFGDTIGGMMGVMGMGMMGGMTLAGCCTEEGLCGVISSVRGTCITDSMFINLPTDPQACGSADDGGVLDDGGS